MYVPQTYQLYSGYYNAANIQIVLVRLTIFVFSLNHTFPANALQTYQVISLQKVTRLSLIQPTISLNRFLLSHACSLLPENEINGFNYSLIGLFVATKTCCLLC